MQREEQFKTLDSDEISQVTGGRYHGWGGGPWGGYWSGYWNQGWNASAWNNYATALAMASLYNSYNRPNVYYVY
jgi:hypothetical protein